VKLILIWMPAKQFGDDVARGAMAASKAIITFVGAMTLVVVVALISNPEMRERAAAVLPTSTLAWASDRLAERASVQASAAQAAIAEAPAKPEISASDEAQQKHVTQYLSRRYRVADGAVRVLVAVAYESGREAGVDPLLVLSVMAIESSMNPFAESSVGAQGLMQVMTRVHAEKFEPLGGDIAALNPVANIQVGTLILQDLIRRGGSVERGLQLYVGAGNHEHDGGYGRRVLAEHARLKLASAGKVELALLQGLRVIQPDATPVSATPAAKPAPGESTNTPSSSGKSGDAA
jgi:hypothetical protein